MFNNLKSLILDENHLDDMLKGTTEEIESTREEIEAMNEYLHQQEKTLLLLKLVKTKLIMQRGGN